MTHPRGAAPARRRRELSPATPSVSTPDSFEPRHPRIIAQRELDATGQTLRRKADDSQETEDERERAAYMLRYM